ncbi:hypothetical protein [Saccharopolyspora pogona]|uniref:hypothetical protein n=1 Tax=Saccharopolyspora pogona TaxID=333966 RepID=UPI001688E8E5|nr:hypothetical protein [Saccharopolyspora pogona]
MDDEHRRREEEDRDAWRHRDDDDRRMRAEVDESLDYIFGTDGSSANVWDDASRPRNSASGQNGIFARWGNVLRGRRG